jgi:MoaA/NifB/PqqE/SkfB family radical SAM enzyme
MDWQTFTRELGLTAEQEPAAKSLVNRAKDLFAEICQRRSASTGVSAFEVIVSELRRLPRPAEEEVAARFFRFLAEETDVDGRPFTELCGEVDENTRGLLAALLDVSQRERVGELYDNLFDLTTGHDPLRSLVRRCLMAGEEPGEPASPDEVREPAYRGLFCRQPFDYAQVESGGSVYLCCPQTLPQPVGNLGDSTLMESWNSDMAMRVRASILDGTYRYCSERTCGLLQQRRLPRTEDVTDAFHRDVIDRGLTRLEKGPATINMSYDRTCNLGCPSCRTEFISVRGRERERVAQIHEKVLSEHLKDAERLIITGSGDPFASHFYLKFLRTFEPESAPGLRIQLSTNGLLLTPAMWESICHRQIDWIDVSVDAARRETYAMNRGGDFARLLDNLAFLGSLRAAGEIRVFQLHFVVQANNYREMKEFTELGLRLGCDQICFKQIVNWGTFSTADFARRAVQQREHPEHEQFLEVLRDPILNHPKIYMHDLGKVHQTIRAESNEWMPTA